MTDKEIVDTINSRAGTDLRITGRAAHGKLGGAIYVEWPTGARSVVTKFLGTADDARATAEILAYVGDRGVPVARHQLVADLGDAVYFVQERIHHVPARLTADRIDGMVAINETFANVLADRTDVLPPPMCVPDNGLVGKPRALADAAAMAPAKLTAGPDLVHTDFSAANVLFDEHQRPTAVVDWNLGIHRGDRWFGLVNTRFDREWFVRSPDADPVESRAAAYLDEILAAIIEPETLRAYWAIWLLHHMRASGPPYWLWELADRHVLSGA